MQSMLINSYRLTEYCYPSQSYHDVPLLFCIDHSVFLLIFFKAILNAANKINILIVTGYLTGTFIVALGKT